MFFCVSDCDSSSRSYVCLFQCMESTAFVDVPSGSSPSAGHQLSNLSFGFYLCMCFSSENILCLYTFVVTVRFVFL